MSLIASLLGLVLSQQQPDLPAIESLAVPGTSTHTSATRGCGAYCTAIAAQRAGCASADVEVAEALVDPDHDGNCSIADLVRGLDGLGVTATPMVRERDHLPPGLNILHVRSRPDVKQADHFIVAEELAGGQYRFYVPPIGSGVDDGKRVLDLWQGRYVRVEPRRASGFAVMTAAAAVGLLAGAVLAWLRRPRARVEVSHG